MNTVEILAKAIYAVRPDCKGKPWPLETAEQRRAYPHNPVASVDLCFEYAKAALSALSVPEAISERMIDAMFRALGGTDKEIAGVDWAERKAMREALSAALAAAVQE